MLVQSMNDQNRGIKDIGGSLFFFVRKCFGSSWKIKILKTPALSPAASKGRVRGEISSLQKTVYRRKTNYSYTK